MKKKKISVFVPIYNESKILKRNIIKIYETLRKISNNFEIFIVDDNSSDNSKELYESLFKKKDNIRYIKYNNGPSRRENLSKSFKLAKGSIISFIDIDLATDLSYTKRLFEEIKHGADISIGSRYVKGAFIKRTLFRKVISHMYKVFMRYFFNSKIFDHQCGFKAFRKEVILDLVNDMKYDKKFVRGWFWDAELLIRAQKKKYKIVEFPVKWHYGKNTTFNLGRELRMIGYILKHRKYFYIRTNN